MSKSRKGKLRHISTHIEPGQNGYSVKVHSHFDSDGDEGGKQMPGQGDDKPSFFRSHKEAAKHAHKHVKMALAQNEGAEPDDDEGQSMMPENDYRRAIPMRKGQ
jgi:hypothetical protein